MSTGHQHLTNHAAGVVRIAIRANGSEDRGVGIVVRRRPLALLVPSHLIVLLEEGAVDSIHVDGVPYDRARILPTPALGIDHLSVLGFDGPADRRVRGIPFVRSSAPAVSSGQDVAVCVPSDPSEPFRTGRIVDVREARQQISLQTDVPLDHGESGSPIFVDDRLIGVCQGRSVEGPIGHAIAIPFSDDALAELRRIQRQGRMRRLAIAGAVLLTLTIALVGFAVQSWLGFVPGSVEVSEDGGMLTVHNARPITLRSTWTRAFDTPIQRYLPIIGDDGAIDAIAVGTTIENGVDGAIHLLDRIGRTLWSYAIPDGECIYSSSQETFDRFLVNDIHAADLDGDGASELLVSFVHEHFYPCKLVVFDPAGEILAEYWHHGYIRTLTVDHVGSSGAVEAAPLVVLSASNNALKTSWWNPQVLFAFRGLDISGQSPPYLGTNGSSEDTAPGSELWYRLIVNIDPELKRAKGYKLDILDSDGDGVAEIRASLTDGRFYYLDEHGTQLRVDLGDRFLQDFGDVEIPRLEEIELRRP